MTWVALFIVPSRTHSYCLTALSEISNRTVGKILLRTIWQHALFFFRFGVYKYCCLVYRTVWCENEVRSTNCARRMQQYVTTKKYIVSELNILLLTILGFHSSIRPYNYSVFKIKMQYTVLKINWIFHNTFQNTWEPFCSCSTCSVNWRLCLSSPEIHFFH